MNYWWQQLLLLLASLVANTFSAFSGGGAGLVQFPVLIFLGLPFGVALATHKIATVALGLGATVRHWREKTVERQLGIQMLVWGLPGVLLGAGAILQIPGRWAELALGFLTIALGVYSMSRRDLGVQHAPRHGGGTGAIVGGVGLFIIGFLNGSLSSGTGLFCTLWLVRWYGLDYRRAVAYTLIFVGMFWNGAGAVTLGVLSRVQWSWLPVLLVGSALGGYVGAHWAIMKGNRWIKRGFEVLTVLIGLKLIF
jgi:uncharacterized membrane protein YfcA